jgi:hypothetical protein
MRKYYGWTYLGWVSQTSPSPSWEPSQPFGVIKRAGPSFRLPADLNYKPQSRSLDVSISFPIQRRKLCHLTSIEEGSREPTPIELTMGAVVVLLNDSQPKLILNLGFYALYRRGRSLDSTST